MRTECDIWVVCRLLWYILCAICPAPGTASQQDRGGGQCISTDMWPCEIPNSRNCNAHAANGTEYRSGIDCSSLSLFCINLLDGAGDGSALCLNNVSSDYHRDSHSTFTSGQWCISDSEWFTLVNGTDIIKVTSWKRCLVCWSYSWI